ncbi:MAG: hypothetical protein A2651_04130 [Candidatus Yanofskybacteria bacterium RIFCSPHIGHO2_01_FULL_42_12]|uniref:Uncharacterized protein n=1 Tax=Candidatus Yanofskybacteria bacterium RIFCSPLOWO2_01_FULL_42_49 TaxID=1802694 RepID=A0A1F8GBW5_9BACT|nr:MAG: hypothetical protein A2651_04130 [Candidatus Yanofskybacteria bacterium RIFCSPHIGHO2_01_FULL_42_12]OGN22875.1 MAG: hypothetical protein A2918_01130 [Candidatus Yanofskybacteria bacterium RIFCSPLOWO2_01_FULL_42_49]
MNVNGSIVVQVILGLTSYTLLGIALFIQFTLVAGIYGRGVSPGEENRVFLTFVPLVLLVLSLYAGAFVTNFFARK